MFPDPITITVGGVAKSLARVKVGDMTATYATADENYLLEVSHTVTKSSRKRTTLRFTFRKTVTDPLTSAVDYDSVTETRTYDQPIVGFSDVEWFNLITGLNGFLTQGNVTKLNGKES